MKLNQQNQLKPYGVLRIATRIEKQCALHCEIQQFITDRFTGSETAKTAEDSETEKNNPRQQKQPKPKIAKPAEALRLTARSAAKWKKQCSATVSCRLMEPNG